MKCDLYIIWSELAKPQTIFCFANNPPQPPLPQSMIAKLLCKMQKPQHLTRNRIAIEQFGSII